MKIHLFSLVFIIFVNGLCPQIKAVNENTEASILGTWLKDHPENIANHLLNEYTTFEKKGDLPIGSYGEVQTLYSLENVKYDHIEVKKKHEKPKKWFLWNEKSQIHIFAASTKFSNITMKDDGHSYFAIELDLPENTKTTEPPEIHEIIELSDETLKLSTPDFNELHHRMLNDPQYHSLSDSAKVKHEADITSKESIPRVQSTYKRPQKTISIHAMNIFMSVAEAREREKSSWNSCFELIYRVITRFFG